MKIKVCAYARVSTNSRAQEHSFEFQSLYWNDKLSNDSKYEYLGLYADKGISGKFANRRPKFMQMVQLVRENKVNMIFCKSVQRFARNTEELLEYVREFREKNVAVVFEKEGINTLTNGTDLYLTIAAAVAEDDLNRYSENMKWTFRDKFNKGEINYNGRMYGFKMNKEDEKFEIIENEAKIVRRIFEMYISGMSHEKIAQTLTEEGILSPLGNAWGGTSISRILHNEKYVGDCISQKNYKVGGKEYVNKGEKDMYFVENHHKGIISRETWNQTQEALKNRANHKLLGSQTTLYPFTNLIKCGCCGKNFNHKVSTSAYTPTFNIWRCKSTRDKCTSIPIKDDELKDLFVDAYNEFVQNKYKAGEELVLQEKANELIKEQNELTRLHANGWISTNSYSIESEKITSKIKDYNIKIDDFRRRALGEQDFKRIDVFNEEKVDRFLIGVVIIGTQVRFKFYNGVVITRTIKKTRIYDTFRIKLKKVEDEYNEI